MARSRCQISRPQILLLFAMSYSIGLSLAYMSYIYYHDWQVTTYPSSPFQKGVKRWTYSAARSFFQDFRDAVGLGNYKKNYRPGVRYDVEHSGYKDMRFEPLHLSCARCAIISSSGHLINSSAGEEIDNTPCIFRMNNAPVKGYEKDVGSRTTVRSMGHVNLIKSFEKDRKARHEMLTDNGTRTEFILINWMNIVHVDVYADQEYRYALLLGHLYPEVQFFAFTPEQMNYTQEVFKNETGIYSFEANTWLSTGWFTMVAAMDLCQEIVVYGMAHEDFCQNATKDEQIESVPYHYYEPDKLKECQYYNKSENRLTGGHLFITEKAVFSNWAVHKKITFKHPSWPVKNQTDHHLDTPFFNKFWAFIKEGGDMAELIKKKPGGAVKKKKTSRNRRRKKKHKEVIITLQKGNENIRVNQDDLVDKLVELLPDVKLIRTDEVDINKGDGQNGKDVVIDKQLPVHMNDTQNGQKAIVDKNLFVLMDDNVQKDRIVHRVDQEVAVDEQEKEQIDAQNMMSDHRVLVHEADHYAEMDNIDKQLLAQLDDTKHRVDNVPVNDNYEDFADEMYAEFAELRKNKAGEQNHV